MNTITTRIDKEMNLIVHVVKGELRITDVIRKITFTMSDPDFVCGMDVIWDVSDATMTHVTVKDMFILVNFMAKNILKRGSGFKLAIIANTDLEFGLAKMYTGYGKFLPFMKNVFRTFHEGLVWIQESKPLRFDVLCENSESKSMRVKKRLKKDTEHNAIQ